MPPQDRLPRRLFDPDLLKKHSHDRIPLLWIPVAKIFGRWPTTSSGKRPRRSPSSWRRSFPRSLGWPSSGIRPIRTTHRSTSPSAIRVGRLPAMTRLQVRPIQALEVGSRGIGAALRTASPPPTTRTCQREALGSNNRALSTSPRLTIPITKAFRPWPSTTGRLRSLHESMRSTAVATGSSGTSVTTRRLMMSSTCSAHRTLSSGRRRSGP